MNTSTIYSYSARNAATLAQPMAKLTVAPAASVLRWTAEQTAAFCLARDANNVAAAERKFAGACAALGAANRRSLKFGRRQAQATALRAINVARAQLRQARAALAASFAAAPAVAA